MTTRRVLKRWCDTLHWALVRAVAIGCGVSFLFWLVEGR
jgi:hypothetical protein